MSAECVRRGSRTSNDLHNMSWCSISTYLPPAYIDSHLICVQFKNLDDILEGTARACEDRGGPQSTRFPRTTKVQNPQALVEFISCCHPTGLVHSVR